LAKQVREGKVLRNGRGLAGGKQRRGNGLPKTKAFDTKKTHVWPPKIGRAPTKGGKGRETKVPPRKWWQYKGHGSRNTG